MPPSNSHTNVTRSRRPESKWQDGSSQIERPQGTLPWNVALPNTPFDRVAFDQLVDVSILLPTFVHFGFRLSDLNNLQDFADKYAANLTPAPTSVPEHLTILLRAAARLLADDSSVRGNSPTTRSRCVAQIEGAWCAGTDSIDDSGFNLATTSAYSNQPGDRSTMNITEDDPSA